MTEENQVSLFKNSEPSKVAQVSDPMLAMIDKYCANPDFNLEVLREFKAIRNEEINRRAKMEFASAFAQMQPKLPAIEKTGAVSYKDKDTGNMKETFRFAKIEDIVEAITPILKEYGFSFSHHSIPSERGIKIVTTLMHIGGYFKETEREASLDTSGGKNNLQAGGSTTSYLKRYNLCDLLGIVTKDEDNDGQTIHMDSEEIVLMKQEITKEKDVGKLQKKWEIVRNNKSRMSREQFLELKAETERVRKEIVSAGN